MALTDDHREMTSAEMHLEIKRLRQAGPQGEWHCDTCGFDLHSRVIDASTGNIGTPIAQEVPPCQNGCGTMRRITWEESDGRASAAICRLHELCEEYERDIKRLRGLLGECKPFVKRIADSEPVCGNDECECHDSVRLLRKLEEHRP